MSNATTRVPENRLDRRRAIGAMVAGIGASVSTCGAEEKSSSTLVVDTHLHCFAGPDDARFPYHDRAPYRPEQVASPERLLERMEGAGVDRAVVVHPEPYQDDHRYLEHCLEVGEGKLKGTCLFFADRPDSIRQLPAFLRRHEEKVVATRLHAYAPGRLPPWGTPPLDRLWRIATESGVAMQIHFEPRYAALLDPYLRQYQDTRVIIDHMGRPMQGTTEEHAVVLRWSELPNTIMKLASIPRQDKYPHREVAPVVRRLYELWGEDRLIYGGGFNADATNETYRGYREMIRRMLPDISEQSAAKIFGGNAARLFGFRI